VFGRNNLGTKITAAIWGAFPLHIAGGLMLVALLAGAWSISSLNERQQNVEQSVQKLSSSQDAKEKNASIYTLLQEARLLTRSGNFMKNADQIRRVYSEVLATDPNNASAYVELAKLDLKVSRATAYKDKAEASNLKAQGISNLIKAKSIYEATGQKDKAAQSQKVINDINGGIAPYNWCFPTTPVSLVPGSNCSKI
jgi:hypothetical protein